MPPRETTIESTRPQGRAAAERPAEAFVAMSRFVVKNDMSEEVREAFENRPGLVEDAPGFVRLEVLRPQGKPEEFWLLTYWSDEASFRAWHRGHTYRDAHAGIPKGLKLDPRATRIRYFEYLCS